MAIDLPQKMLVYKNEKEEVFVAFNDPLYLAKRHGINENREEFGKINAALNALAQAATADQINFIIMKSKTKSKNQKLPGGSD